MPPKIPDQITVESLRFRVYKLGDGRLAFDYKDGSKRKVVKRSSIEDLKSEADRIGAGILNAETAALSLTAEHRRIAQTAFESILHTGQTLDAIARDAAEAYAITRGRISLAELARFWIGRNPAGKCPPTAAILDELLAVLRERRRSDIYLRDLQRDLAPFAAAQGDLSVCSDRHIADYLRTRGEISTRRRDNIRDAIVRLFSYARERHYLPQDRNTEAQKVARIDEGVGQVTTYSPAQIRILLAKVDPVWRPWFLIAAFAGLRTSEIFRLEWSAIRLEERLIYVNRRVAKKIRVSRKVPITENLAEFLAEYSERGGALYPNQKTHGIGPSWRAVESRHIRALDRLTKAAGVAWESNALRHSFGSHRLAIIKNEAQLVLEMGNSISQVREHYHDPKSDHEAAEYFDIRPANHDNVLHLPLQFRKS